jgi:hypothetical protein
VDWNPSTRKIRQFGGLLALFLLLIAWRACRKGHVDFAVALAGTGVLLGSAIAAFPRAGLRLYQAWMAAAFVIGTIVSAVVLTLLYFGIVTPLGLFFRWRGRDALGLDPGGRESYWVPLEIPEDKTYYERLS